MACVVIVVDENGGGEVCAWGVGPMYDIGPMQLQAPYPQEIADRVAVLNTAPMGTEIENVGIRPFEYTYYLSMPMEVVRNLFEESK